MERTVSKSNRTAHRGFSLTELLVAMAIFLVLMSGLVTMFDSAVTTARQGYASIDAFENARSAMKTFDRDLTSAFVSEEFGQTYNFYGRPEGFMFVGALDEGQLGRVTYVFHPELNKRPFQSTITLQWGVVKEYVRRQYQRLARERDFYGSDAFSIVPTALNELDTAFGSPADTELVPLNVIIETESLIRVEEVGITNLDTFDMYVKVDGVGDPIRLNWPYIDPINSALDDPIGPMDPNEAAQFNFLYGALNTDTSTTTYDLRNVYSTVNAGGEWHPVTGDRLYLRVLGRDTFDTLIRTRKREFWIRMLSGQDMGVQDLIPTPGDPFSYWYDEGSDFANAFNHNVVNEYVVADGIIARAIILNPATGDPMEFPDVAPMPHPLAGTYFDALDAHVKFSYSDGINGSTNFFNAVENFVDPDNPYDSANLVALLGQGTAGYSNADVVFVDSAMADRQLNVARTRLSLGSPLLPRIPELVTPAMWVTRPKTRPGAPDFQRFFEQTIQVPSARGRAASTVIARSPGSP